MKLYKMTMLILAAFLLLGSNALAQDAGNAGAGAQEIEMTAKKYEFNPDVIKVKKGDHVKLVITASDRDHGIKIETFKINQRLKKGVPTTVEFTADKAGEYPFECSVICGFGHHKMKGKIIVEE